MSQKITLISFDHWNYDVHIINALQKKGVDAFHIKIGAFKHKNFFTRLNNTFSKIFLNKNPKIKKRQDFIIDTLKARGIQDQILVINPELIDLNYHQEIQKYTKKYIAYLYDSVERNPVLHLLNANLFNSVYSFDKSDCLQYGFQETTNYIYFQKKITQDSKIDYVYVGSIDNRINFLNEVAEIIKKRNQSFNFYAIGKKATVFKIKQLFTGKYKNIQFKRKLLTQQETLQIYSRSTTILDLVRDNQTGLSFRIFEAMGLQKNILTNNKIIKEYDIYASNKVAVFSEDLNFNFEIISSFYSDTLIEKYSIETWVSNIFNLEK